MNIEILKSTKLGGSVGFSVFLKEFADLIDKGWARPYTAHSDNHFIIVAIDKDNKDKVVGGIVFNINENTNSSWVILTFVIEAYRRRGIQTKMQEAYENHLLQNTKATKILSTVNVENVPFLAAAEKLGRIPKYIQFEKILKG